MRHKLKILIAITFVLAVILGVAYAHNSSYTGSRVSITTGGEEATAINPVPVAGGDFLIQTNEIDQANSSLSVGWEGTIDDLLNDKYAVLTNSTSNNPKTITIHLLRPHFSNLTGISTLTGTFRNTRISAIGGDGSLLVLLDESTDSTPKTRTVVPLQPFTTTGYKIEFLTDQPVSASLFNVPKGIATLTNIQAVSELTDATENINSFKHALKVDAAYVHTTGINEKFIERDSSTTTLAVAPSAGDTSITVVDSTGFLVGDSLIIDEIDRETDFFVATDVTANVITLDRPLDFAHFIGDAVEEVITDASVVGTLTSPRTFSIAPPPGRTWQIARFIFSMVLDTNPDDANFGDIAALTNGLTLRSNKNGVYHTYSNWKNNAEIKAAMYDVLESGESPSGNFGITGRWTFLKFGTVIELCGDTNDRLDILVQDDLTDIISFSMRAQGRIFSQ